MKSCSDTFKSFKTEVVECIEFCNDIFEEGGVAFVQSPEKERQVAIVCAALAWARQNQQTAEETGGRKFRVLFMSRHDETLLKIRQEIQLSGYEDLDLVLTTYESFFEQLLSDTCRDQLKSSTQEQKEFSLENTAVIVEDADMVDQELREAASNSLSLCVIRKLIKIFDKNAQEDQGLLEVIELAESFESKLFRGIALHKGCDTDPSFSLEDLETIFSRMKVKEFDIEGLATKFNDPGILKIIKFLLCVLNRIKDHKAANNSKSFRMYLTDVWSNGGHEEDCQCGSGCKTIHFICLDASVVLEKMMKQKPHAVIFSSSSLSDYKYLKRELGVNESKEFVGKSSVEDHQIFTRIVTCGVGGYFMNSSYNEWFDVDYMMSLGKTIVKFAEVTPPGEGIIIYLPSKEFKEACLTTWQSDVLNCIAEHKDIFLDPSVLIKHNSFESHLVTTPEESQKCKGPCSFAVLSAKECQDFSIIPLKCRRVVLVVGIPKNNLKDPKIKLKIQSFKENVDSSGLRNLGLGEEYMKQESYKLLRHVIDNQISSLSDYSVILLLDTNYDVGSLPPWLGPKVIWEKRFAELIQELTDFFHVVENRIQWIQDKCQNPTQISTQFGSVRKWEMEKLSLEYRRLKKSNESQQKLIFSLQKKYSDACTHQLELENKLKGFTSPRKRLHQE